MCKLYLYNFELRNPLEKDSFLLGERCRIFELRNNYLKGIGNYTTNQFTSYGEIEDSAIQTRM